MNVAIGISTELRRWQPVYCAINALELAGPYGINRSTWNGQASWCIVDSANFKTDELADFRDNQHDCTKV